MPAPDTECWGRQALKPRPLSPARPRVHACVHRISTPEFHSNSRGFVSFSVTSAVPFLCLPLTVPSRALQEPGPCRAPGCPFPWSFTRGFQFCFSTSVLAGSYATEKDADFCVFTASELCLLPEEPAGLAEPREPCCPAGCRGSTEETPTDTLYEGLTQGTRRYVRTVVLTYVHTHIDTSPHAYIHLLV